MSHLFNSRVKFVICVGEELELHIIFLSYISCSVI